MKANNKPKTRGGEIVKNDEHESTSIKTCQETRAKHMNELKTRFVGICNQNKAAEQVVRDIHRLSKGGVGSVYECGHRKDFLDMAALWSDAHKYMDDMYQFINEGCCYHGEKELLKEQEELMEAMREQEKRQTDEIRKPNMTPGKFVKAIRLSMRDPNYPERKISQKDFAQMVGVSTSAINFWETDIHIPSELHIKRIIDRIEDKNVSNRIAKELRRLAKEQRKTKWKRIGRPPAKKSNFADMKEKIRLQDFATVCNEIATNCNEIATKKQS